MLDRNWLLAAPLISLMAGATQAEEIFYGNRAVGVELRSDSSTLVMLPAPPLSVNCQPANVIKFEVIDADSLSAVEVGYVSSEKKPDEGFENPRVKRMLRISAQRKGSETSCTFNLANASQVGVQFNLRPDIIRPFIEFRPLSERNANIIDPTRNLALDALKASIGGEPAQFIKDNRSIFGYSASKTTRLAKYRLVYKGSNGSSLTLWKIDGVVRAERIAYEDLAILSAPVGAIFYSAVVPDRTDLQDGELFTLHIIGSNSLTGTEIMKALR